MRLFSPTLALLLAASAAPGSAQAESCLICDNEVVLDRKLAACFLDRYDVLQTKQGSAIPVDLTDCPEPAEKQAGEQDRGVVEALKMPQTSPGKPDPTFMVTRVQLICLKRHLEAGLVPPDSVARISLDQCE